MSFPAAIFLLIKKYPTALSAAIFIEIFNKISHYIWKVHNEIYLCPQVKYDVQYAVFHESQP